MKISMFLLLLLSKVISADDCTYARGVLSNAIAICEQYKIDWVGRPISGFTVAGWDDEKL